MKSKLEDRSFSHPARFLSCIAIIFISMLLIYVGCLRSYSIYLFELESKSVIFLETWIALSSPFFLSLLLAISYLSGKIRKLLDLRKDSQEMTEEEDLDLITDQSSGELEKPPEGDQIFRSPPLRSGGYRRTVSEMDSGTNIVRTRRSLSVDDTTRKEPRSHFIPRKLTIASCHVSEMRRKSSQAYEDIGKISLLPPLFERIKAIAEEEPFSKSVYVSGRSTTEVLLQFLGIHLPIWLCVITLHVSLLELFHMKFAQKSQAEYTDGRVIFIIAFFSIAVGVFHEIKWTWFVNDILGVALSFIMISRVQTVSFISGFTFMVGMISFDLFWMYGIDVFSTVTKQNHAPVMLMIPYRKGGFQSLAFLDIVVPGIFLNVVFKFSEMYEPTSFTWTFYSVLFGLVATNVIAFYREKSMPAIVLPGLLAISSCICSIPRLHDLWSFQIRR
ncbi:hypothetical protein AB6A40_000061 [Gnathostoma spinigerum]|uniref:Uncharacterized protein n=1 Tax=Gnathostoma spinigerum TaxID=75299 RepID=A0ABD6E9J8_9BILA